MMLRETIGHCLEAAAIEKQPARISEQLASHSRGDKAVGAVRCLPIPRSVLGALVGVFKTNVLPFQPDRVHPSPDMYGANALVHRVPTTSGEIVVKRLRSMLPHDEHLAYRREILRRYQECFGELVIPTSLLVVENVYRGEQPMIAAVQPFVKGVSVFDNPGRAKPEHLQRILDGTERMVDSYSNFPDFSQKSNVRIDSEGDVHMIDVLDGVCERPQVVTETGQNFLTIREFLRTTSLQ